MNSTGPSGSAQEPFSIEVRVYFEDTDAAGVVYYANYLRFMERARTEYLRSMGVNLGELAKNDGLTFVVVSVQLNYRRPAGLDDLLWVGARVIKRGGSSLVFDQEIRRGDETGELLCDGTVRVACVCTEQMAPCAIPNTLGV